MSHDRPESVDELIEKWLDRKGEWTRLQVRVDGVAIAGEIVDDLDHLVQRAASQVLNLAEASVISGYSAEHLGRLVRNGILPNVGRRGAPRVRRCDVPLKPTRMLAADERAAYDANTDARFLRARR